MLHPVSEWEAEALVAGIENPAYPWIEGYPHADTTDAIRHFLELNHIHGALKGFGIWQIIRQSDRCIIGDIGFYGPPDVEGNVTVGFELAVSARGQRFATEALFALLEVGTSSARRSARMCSYCNIKHGLPPHT